MSKVKFLVKIIWSQWSLESLLQIILLTAPNEEWQNKKKKIVNWMKERTQKKKKRKEKWPGRVNVRIVVLVSDGKKSYYVRYSTLPVSPLLTQSYSVSILDNSTFIFRHSQIIFQKYFNV